LRDKTCPSPAAPATSPATPPATSPATSPATPPARERPDFFSHHDLHIHVPAGSVPKDGPSAGIPIALAVLSALSGRPIHRDIAMTGEITLRGDVLPIGGLKEKVLAAKGAGVRAVILPRLNERDLAEIDPEFKRGLRFHFVDHLDEASRLALQPEVPDPPTEER